MATDALSEGKDFCNKRKSKRPLNVVDIVMLVQVWRCAEIILWLSMKSYFGRCHV